MIEIEDPFRGFCSSGETDGGLNISDNSENT